MSRYGVGLRLPSCRLLFWRMSLIVYGREIWIAPLSSRSIRQSGMILGETMCLISKQNWSSLCRVSRAACFIAETRKSLMIMLIRTRPFGVDRTKRLK